jgi:hypothetical protein
VKRPEAFAHAVYSNVPRGWLLAYLPIALRRVYGGSRLMTGLRLAALGTLYVLAFLAVPAIFAVALLQF